MGRHGLETASEVIDALGGTAAVARLTNRQMQHVSNWRSTGRLPPDTFLIMTAELHKIRLAAPSEIWGIPSSREAVS